MAKPKGKKFSVKAGYVKLGWHDNEMKAEDFIVKISKLVNGPVNMMRECEGDLYCSDQRQLSKAASLLFLASEEIKERKQ
jgi:hypothetical protein